MTTPGNCSAYPGGNSSYINAEFTPICSGGSDSMTLITWALGTFGPGPYATDTVTGAIYPNDGREDTAILVAQPPYYTDTNAARYCYFMNYGGYSDWYLPGSSLNVNGTDGELYNVLFLHEVALNFWADETNWWGSTENGAANSNFVTMGEGYQNSAAKWNVAFVHCIRKY
jgi:hypothetical protein